MTTTEGLIFEPLPTRKDFKNLNGLKFSRLTVLGFAGYAFTPKGQKYTRWHCICDCGKGRVVRTTDLTSGRSASCGCRRREQIITHGHTVGGSSTTFTTWIGMIQRTTNPNNPRFADYGGRGIIVDPTWLKFEAFLADMGESPSKLHSLDRIDNDGNYEPGNCRWATITEQNRNARSNRILEYKGERLCMAEWSEKLGFKESVIRYRLNAGWTVDRALTTPSRARVLI